MNENAPLFGQARFQIELKPNAAVEAVIGVIEQTTHLLNRKRMQPVSKDFVSSICTFRLEIEGT
jgi:hypothetical protein